MIINKKERIIMRLISRFTKKFLFNTKVREGDFHWDEADVFEMNEMMAEL